ncbi:glycine cleavage system protein H [candidate division WOR-1 bacterium RIFOXYA12_FULL_43_27]|uniref:Glycine cleavage system H protein n=1 Tax=candidate division WOR-1 bacterium RIFOXYC2_FULL_46_14 TaxID=1802587 RepID=A0A1F4U4R1_UNCSA|nr:MAG: glycine cleavage system protein H [candidate division WOR-1 bacterium RIFOXYA12_FULL_43_27]OGC20811.1 MAG: glycine cleavage system protein H [candidate division WOR-1 bacterium RIFOXYB2_FULL_46_45]OGC31452.1 MAG: glycine cleavage system protein H [candidate division WOR-1 bacterium RIFOXYA2_FULL_46_56]OGC39857.1 MAG: glycine cleavage system protein H [candidate division WOR-1 bacterium RIFOXYC2_FULL_46_14]
MYPENLKYSTEHEWAKVDGVMATIGISHYAQDSLGDVVYVELPAEGKTVGAMDNIGVVESVKTVSTLYSPVAGEVVEVNKELQEKPALVNEDPYGKGWMLKIKMSNPADLDKLLSASDYQAQLH